STAMGVPLDAGASWLHGLKNNVLRKLARELNLKTHKTDFDDTSTYRPDGSEDEAFYKIVDALEDAFYDRAETVEPELTVSEAMQGLAEEFSLSQNQWEHFLGSAIEADYAGDVDDLTVAALLEGTDPKGGDAIIDGGYVQIVEHLAKYLDIRREVAVTQIDWSGERVRAVTSQGDFEADRVVVTLPLGVLRSGDVTFAPALPDAHEKAIQGMGVGLLNKLFLRFPSVFWDADETFFGIEQPSKSRLVTWMNMYEFTGEPILIAFSAAEDAKALEQLSDEETVDEAMDLLRDIFGSNVPAPEQCEITRWWSDPWSCGSYSYLGKGASPQMRSELAAPVGGKLFFAGEATHMEFPSTAHGAYLSGLRAADEVIASLELL
ncbi:MAG: FAD-dependent oxidoreductase, partial [Pseudomonadota bacterium]